MAKVAGILGKKVGMTQLFDSKGEVRPATVLQAGPCVVTQHKTATRDGYESAQIGLVEFVKEKRLTKPMRGHFGKNNLPPMKFLREVPIEVDEVPAENAPTNGLKVGQRVLVDIFEGDRFVDIVGISNLVTFLEHTEAYRRDLRHAEYGDERDPKMRTYLESIAPIAAAVSQ